MWYTSFFSLIDLQLFYHVLQKKLENTEAYAVTLLASVEVRNLAKTTRNVTLFGKIYLQVFFNDIKMPYVSQTKKLR